MSKEAKVPDISRLAPKPRERLQLVTHILDTPLLEETDYLEWEEGLRVSREASTLVSCAGSIAASPSFGTSSRRRASRYSRRRSRKA